MWKRKEWWNIQLTLGILYGPFSQHGQRPPRHQPHLLIPSAQAITQKKQRTQKWDSTPNQSYRTAWSLHTQKPGLREVDLEPSPKTGSDKINMQKKGRNTQKKSKSYDTAWIHLWIPALRGLYLEPNAKRGSNRSRALVSLYSPPPFQYPQNNDHIADFWKSFTQQTQHFICTSNLI